MLACLHMAGIVILSFRCHTFCGQVNASLLLGPYCLLPCAVSFACLCKPILTNCRSSYRAACLLLPHLTLVCHSLPYHHACLSAAFVQAKSDTLAFCAVNASLDCFSLEQGLREAAHR
jgi:hypothetical protein